MDTFKLKIIIVIVGSIINLSCSFINFVALWVRRSPQKLLSVGKNRSLWLDKAQS